ncbi:FimV family protein [Aquitalea sp. LB_tupeE]|uniref:type IV pilus assembly protein FimV n=1 Tax=Aquitalea sp. LB_tupeE TaxID=2748078 RepID=UPI0015BD080F|nr:pilus assembly protein FimV [Aquitalea sp. LB_tupeE]NWK79122.1 pilus assembly protein FimV [Aquitalea sp. LB_tupeE]
MASTHRMTLLALLLAGMGATGSALAGLGPIHVLSSEGQPFEAEIPVVDEDPQGNVLVGLADRNKYPLVSTYSQSAPVLKFSAIRKPDGSIQKILVKGPSRFDEPLLRFAVEMSWPAGRLVREFEVDYLRDGPPRKDKQPGHDDTVKKSVVAPDQMPRLGSLGLGQLKVNSKLGEPLVAELELFGTAARQTDNIHVALTADSLQGSPSAEQSQLIASISHQLSRVADKAVLQLRSTRPLNEPVLAFRLDVGAANVHAQKRYTLLLDPNGYTVEEHAVTPAPESKQAAAQVQPLKVYRVRHGDTLSRIASRMKGGGSAAETAGRLYEGNPDAFIGGDVNRLRAGTALKYPAAWHLAAAPGSHQLKQAGAEEKPLGKPVAQAAAPIAAPAAASHEAPAKPVVPPDAVSLKPMVKVPPATAKPTASAPATSAPQVSAVKGVSPGAAINEQEARLKNILQRQDQVLQQAQQKAQELEQKIRMMQLAKAAEASAAAIAAQNKPVASQAAAEPAASHASTSAPQAAQPAVASAPHAEASKAVTPAKPVVSKAPEAEKPASFLVDDVLTVLHDNAVPLAGGAAVIGLSGLLLAQRRRRNKQETAQPPGEPLPAADNPSMLTMGPLTTLMSGIKRGEGIDLASVDLIAEAEVYLAYGRLDQALDILREGLVREPMRQDLRYKLLEVLAMMPDKDGFIAEATTARGIFGKDSTLWMRVCELGRTLAPEHPLFDMQPVAVASPIDLQPVRLTSASAEHAPDTAVAAEGGIDLAAELGAVEPPPEPVLDTEFLQKPAAGPAPLPPAAEHNDPLSGLDAFASLGEQELENAVKQAPEPMLDMDFLADLPASPAPETPEAPVSKPTPPAAAPTSQSEANDKMELAKLYLEMGDKETAEALMKEAGQTV